MTTAASELPFHIPGRHRLLTQSANIVSASRFALACIWVTAFLGDRGQFRTLGVIASCAAASDLLDGRIARFTHSASHFGRWLDSMADIVFILAVLSCEAYRAAIPAYLPALVAASFAQYAVDSVLIRGSAVPVKSRLGHWAGIVNYIIVIALAWAPALRFHPGLPPALPPVIGSFYLAAMSERAMFYRTARRPHATSISGQQPVSRRG
jgi:phosphatidylglycerophosphate synthase